MRILSYVRARYEDGAKTGVPRFDHELRKVFPDMESVTTLPILDPKRDLVITDNHLSLDVPESVKTIVVHHGCAQTHWDRDPAWQTPETADIVSRQRVMLTSQNRWFVAPSRWVAAEFEKLGAPKATVIPHWVKMFEPARREIPSGQKPIVIGDWRNDNKGAGVIGAIRSKMKNVEFRKLDFDPTGREAFYRQADAYLCLSVSEGAPYAVADAEACSLRVIMTDVGFIHEFPGATIIPWQKRGDPDVVAYRLAAALRARRMKDSYYSRYTFEDWSSSWKGLVDSVWNGSSQRAPGSPQERPAAVTVSLAGGIGNSLFNLPLLSALKSMDIRVTACVETDAPTTELWKRCRYVDRVISSKKDVSEGDLTISGPWGAPGFPVKSFSRWRDEANYNKPEWDLILELATKIGWKGGPIDVSDWCRDLARPLPSETKFDFGIIPGCKDGEVWRRKRYPGMRGVAGRLVFEGHRVAVFGEKSDVSDGEFPGESMIGKFKIEELPEALSSCRVLIGTDSGPAHLGASLGIPTVMIFTATSSVKGDPVGQNVSKIHRSLECSPCQSTSRWKRCNNWVCGEIPESWVVSEALKMLKKAALPC